MIIFVDKTLLITRGTGSLGNAVPRCLLHSDIKEIPRQCHEPEEDAHGEGCRANMRWGVRSMYYRTTMNTYSTDN